MPLIPTTTASDSRPDDPSNLSPDDRILREARQRYADGQNWESEFQTLYISDVKFANADPDNNWQWPQNVLMERDKRPCLTINKVRPLVAMIVNDARENKPQVKVKPVGGQLTYKAAEVWDDLIRQIERVSAAQMIYDDATESMVEGGIGYWRINHDYVDDDSFDQEIRIDPIRDQLSVLMDNWIKRRDGSDAKWAFIAEGMSREEFHRQYPGSAIPPPGSPFDGKGGWVTRDAVRIVEYYRIVMDQDELIYLEDRNGTASTFRRSEIPAQAQAIRDRLVEIEASPNPDEYPGFMKRRVDRPRLEWYKIAGGTEILEKRKLKGKYIPIVRIIADEKVIEGKLHRTGLTRKLKDAQRMYNYNSSAQVEYGALGTKCYWLTPAAAIEGNTHLWNNINTTNRAYIPWKHRDNIGEIPEPRRIEPPATAPAFIEGARIAAAEFEMISGMNPAQAKTMATSEQRSGKAIQETQRQGDVINYHYIDAVAIGIRHTGNIILDLAPHVYNTARVIKVLGRDGTQREVSVVPDAQEAFKEQQEDQQSVKILFNPTVGRFMVEADVGPAYATQRQEAWNAFVQIVTQNAELTNMIGDLGFQAADFPMADKIAERLKRNIRQNLPWLLDDNENTIGPIIQQLQAALGDKDKEIAELIEKMAELNIKLRGRDELRDIEVYDAQTRRLAGVGNTVTDIAALGLSKETLEQVVRKTLHDMIGFDLSEVEQTVAEDIEQPPMEGARKATDGEWYVEDKNRPGKYARVKRNALPKPKFSTERSQPRAG